MRTKLTPILQEETIANPPVPQEEFVSISTKSLQVTNYHQEMLEQFHPRGMIKNLGSTVKVSSKLAKYGNLFSDYYGFQFMLYTLQGFQEALGKVKWKAVVKD